MNRKQKKMLRRILSAAAMMAVLAFLPVQGLPRFALYLVPYLAVGHDILRKAVRGVLNRQVFDENFLMAVATVGAMALGLSGSGDYTEAVAVMLFYQTGELFQSCAVGKSRSSIAQLMDIRPEWANLETEDGTEETDPEEVPIGSVIQVRPGERVPLDGVVLEGVSALDTCALTGESLPRDVVPGDDIVSGCINLSGLLRIRTTKVYGESTVARILDLVENASSRKSRSEAFISRFARVYTPVVCYSALALALLPPLVRLLALGLSPDWGVWCYRSLTFLVISCPCALVISVPLTFFAGIGGASSAGVLVKGSNYLEALAQVDTLVFDKTGTLTRGVFSVAEVCPEGMTAEELLEYAALAESASSHPISRSLRQAWGREPQPGRVSQVREISGEGVTALVDGCSVAAGNSRLMERLGISHRECARAGTVVHVAVDGAYAGYILITDLPKPTAAAAIAALGAAGVRRTVMLTGDSASAAEETARALGITEYRSQLLPGDKVAVLEEILSRPGGRGKVAFAGDGINDAPVLSRADVGIAMGAMGADAAIEAADVVLMDDDPLKIAKAIRIARKCMGIVRQNIAFAIGVKLLCLLLGAMGIANMWLAIFADVGVMVLAVLNAIRALAVKDL